MFLVEPFFLHDQKINANYLESKIKYLENKRAFKVKLKAFFIIFKGFSLKQITEFFWRMRA